MALILDTLPQQQDFYRQTTLRYIAYYVDYAKQNRYRYERLVLEIGNILGALRTAYEHGVHAAYIAGVEAMTSYLGSSGKEKTAENLLNNAISIARSTRNRGDEAKLLALLGDLSMRIGNYATSEAQYQQGLALCSTQDPSLVDADLYRGLGTLYFYRGELEAAHDLLQKALDLTRHASNSRARASALVNMATILHQRGAHEDIVSAYLIECFEIFESIGDLANAALALSNQGALAYERGDWSAAEKHFARSLVFARQVGDLEKTARQAMNLGVVAKEQRKLAQAGVYFGEAWQLARQTANLELQSTVLTSLGELAHVDKEWPRAKHFYEQAMAIAERIGHQENVAWLLGQLGELAYQEERYLDAEALLEQESTWRARWNVSGHSANCFCIGRRYNWHWIISTWLLRA
ncbi:MAG: tetratricopeptide repeat protein [Caldilineaceae bacterium]